jgi:hypothetical protein
LTPAVFPAPANTLIINSKQNRFIPNQAVPETPMRALRMDLACATTAQRCFASAIPFADSSGSESRRGGALWLHGDIQPVSVESSLSLFRAMELPPLPTGQLTLKASSFGSASHHVNSSVLCMTVRVISGVASLFLTKRCLSPSTQHVRIGQRRGHNVHTIHVPTMMPLGNTTSVRGRRGAVIN